MKRRAISTIKTIVIIVFTIIIAFQHYKYEKLVDYTWDVVIMKDSLVGLGESRYLEEVAFYRPLKDSIPDILPSEATARVCPMHMLKDSIMGLLPPPISDTIYVITEDTSERCVYSYHWKLRFLVAQFKKPQEPLLINCVMWKIPYITPPDLYIGFVKDSAGQWRAEDCMQWYNTWNVKID